jgi:hypothetical protein
MQQGTPQYFYYHRPVGMFDCETIPFRSRRDACRLALAQSMSDYDKWNARMKKEHRAFISNEHNVDLNATAKMWKATEDRYRKQSEQYAAQFKASMENSNDQDKIFIRHNTETNANNWKEYKKIVATAEARKNRELDLEKKQLDEYKDWIAVHRETAVSYAHNLNEEAIGNWILPGSELLAAGFDAARWTSTVGKIFEWTLPKKSSGRDLSDPTKNAIYLVPLEIAAVGPLMDCQSSVSAKTIEFSSFRDIQEATTSKQAHDFNVMVGYENDLTGDGVSAEVGGSMSETKEASSQQRNEAGGYGKMERTETKAIVFKTQVKNTTSLSAEFQRDLSTLIKGLRTAKAKEAAEAFMWTYGTHFVVASDIGGEIAQDVFFKKKWVEDHSTSQMQSQAENEFNVGIAGDYAGFSASASYGQANAESAAKAQEYGNKVTEETSTDNVVFHGGVPSQDFQAWCSSTKDTPALVNPLVAPITHFLTAANLATATTVSPKPTASDLATFKIHWGRRHWCHNAGTVVTPAVVKNQVSCTCDVGYEGKNCQFMTKDNCYQTECNGNGKCFTVGGCLCNLGKTGASCDQDTVEVKAAGAAARANGTAGWFTFHSVSELMKTQKYGGTGGHDFDCSKEFSVGKTYRVWKVQAWTGSEVDKLQLTYQVKELAAPQPPLVCTIGGGGGVAGVEAVLDEGEYVTALRIRAGGRIDAINQLDTNFRSFPLGGGTGGGEANIVVNGARKCMGFYGRAGARIDALGIIEVDKQQ